MNSSPNTSDNARWWILAITSTFLGLLTLFINANLIRVVIRGGIESAQWQFGLVPLFAIAIIAAVTGGNSIAHRPSRFPKFIIPALFIVNAALMTFLLFKFRS